MTRPADHDPAIDDTPIARAGRDLPDLPMPAGWEARLAAAHRRAGLRRRANRRAIAAATVALAAGALWLATYACN